MVLYIVCMGFLKQCKIYMKKLIFILLSLIQFSNSYNLKVVNKSGETINLKILQKTQSQYLYTNCVVGKVQEWDLDVKHIKEIKLIQSFGWINDYISISLPNQYCYQLLVLSIKDGTLSDIAYEWLTEEQYDKKYLKVT